MNLVPRVLVRRISALAGRSAGTGSHLRVSEASREQTYPEPFPDGWYVLARSGEVERKPLYVEALGHRFVLFRSDLDGEVAVLDADCPHLGANLAGGRVVDGCIECPFHKWRFGADGRAASIPYGKRVAASMAARAWVSREGYGLVFVYFSTRRRGRGPAPEPPYGLPDYPAIAAGTCVYRGRHDPKVVGMHLVEFAENSADFRHFLPLHGDMLVPWTSIKVPGVTVRHEASWEPDAEEPHVAWFRNEAKLEVLGRLLEGSGANAAIRFHGPGGVVVFEFDLRGKGRILVFQTHTPVRPMAQQVRFTWFADAHLPRLLVSYVVGSWVSQWRADVRIWESKVYRHKPMLTQGDGPIHEMRRWYRQFYPDAASAS